MVTKFSKEPRNEMTKDEVWNWKRYMSIGWWNVRGVFWPGALKVLYSELWKLNFDILALQETRLESRIQKFEKFTLFNSGLENKKHEFDCGFYVKRELLKYVKDFKIIYKRICYLRLKTKWFPCTLINVHTPTNEKLEEIRFI